MKTIPVVLLILATIGPLGIALKEAMSPLTSGPVAAVFPPWWDAAKAMASAGATGAVIRLGAFPFIVIVLAADRTQLKLNGAWLLLNPLAFGGCLASAS